MWFGFIDGALVLIAGSSASAPLPSSEKMAFLYVSLEARSSIRALDCLWKFGALEEESYFFHLTIGPLSAVTLSSGQRFQPFWCLT